MAKKATDAKVYMDAQRLLEQTYKLQFCMTQANRIVIGDRMLGYVLDMIKHITLAFDGDGYVAEHVNQVRNNFIMFDCLLKFVLDKGILQKDAKIKIYETESTFKQEKLSILIQEIVGKLDEGIMKWLTYTRSKQESLRKN